jgi:uncharacterized protein with GYD domain
MPKYLFEVDYTASGTAGLMKDGGSARRAAVTQAIEALGGNVETFYFTFGLRDAVVIAELPDNVAAAAISLAVSASGSVAYRTTTLLTPEEIDEAVTRNVSYQPPGE